MRILPAFLFFVAFFTAQASTADGEGVPDTLQQGYGTVFCDYLIKKNDLNAAMLEFERSREMGGRDSVRLACGLGRAFLRDYQAEKAEYFFTEACSMARPGSRDYGVAFNGLLRAYLFAHKAALARQELVELDGVSRASIGAGDCVFLKGAVEAASYRVDSARATIAAIAHNPPYTDRVRRLDSLLRWYGAQSMKHPMHALLYSAVVPGAGHWYAGDRKKACAAFGLMAALSGLICWEGYHFYRGDARQRFVSGMDIFLLSRLVWYRYYARIRIASYGSAAGYNRDVQLSYREGLRRILLDE